MTGLEHLKESMRFGRGQGFDEFLPNTLRRQRHQFSAIAPADFGTLKTTEKATGTAQFVVSPDNSMNGYNVVRSNQVTSGDFYFGNFADLLIGMYGGLDITVDPYALSTSGGVRIVALQTVDVAVRHAVSFCKSSD